MFEVTVIFGFLLLVCQCFAEEKLTIGSQAVGSTYSTKYDNVDIKEILASERLLKNYVNCLLDKGPCTPDGVELKKNLPDAINTNCAKCSKKQEKGSEEIMHYIIDNKPEWWDELEKMYKSDGSYKRNYLNKKEREEKLEHKSDEGTKKDSKENTTK